MTDKEKSNKKLNNHKAETNELIPIIEGIIKNISKIEPNYSQIDNIVETYRDKIYDIYTELEKKSIDFWSDEFLIGDLIRYYLETIMYHSVEDLLSLATEVLSKKKRIFLGKNVNNNNVLKELKESNKYIKDYSINNNIYDTLIWYYSNIPVISFKPKEIIYSYIKIRNKLKLMDMGKLLTEEKEKNIIAIIEKKEVECLEYRKKYNQILNILKEIANKDEEPNIQDSIIKQRKKEYKN